MIQLSDSFNYRKLLQFTFPSIVMMIFTSIYGMADGFFVSNFAGKTPFAAVNFIMPILLILGCVGFMFGTGGSALISKTLGEGKSRKANELFSMLVYVSIILGILLAVLGFFLIRPVAVIMGAEGELLEDCLLYGKINLLALPFYILQYEFQCLFAAAEKPKLGLYITVASGITNMVLDGLFVAVFSWGLAGAAAATAFSQFVGGILPVFYFAGKSESRFQLVRFQFDGRALVKICTNGASELMSNISMSFVGMLYNIQLMKYAGENGVAAYGVLMYVSMVFQAVFLGYAVGMAPVVSYHYGAGNKKEVKNLLRRSILLIGSFSAAMCVMGELLGRPFSVLFVGYDGELLDLTAHAFAVFSLSFLFSGFAILGSSFFTALNDGLTSALISFLRTLVFEAAAIMIFPLIWGIDGIWWSVVAAEILAVLVTILFLVKKRKRYLN